MALQTLPGERFIDYSELSLKVTRSSTLEIKRVLYSVPSRMIGETVRVHVYHDRLAFFVGQILTSILARVYPKAGQERGRCIDYRHIIHSLSAKPQAFRFLQFRDELLAGIDNNKLLPNLKTLQERYLGHKPVPTIPARQQDLQSYDHLLQGHWYHTEAGHA